MLCTVLGHPWVYRRQSQYPTLRGEGHCSHCLCAPCVIEQPPDFLVGSCDPHPANSEKRHNLYRDFWRLLRDLCVWNDQEYSRRKETRTVRDDRREIMPTCIIMVSINFHYLCTSINQFMLEVRRRYPSHDDQYTDYMSTFDAEAM